MGASIAMKLSEQGLDVSMIDRDVPGKHASYKAGGMLGAQNEFYRDSPLFRLAGHSRQYFKSLSQELYDTTGIDIQYRETGLIKMANSGDDDSDLIKQFNFLNTHNDEVTWLNNDDISNLGNQFIRPNGHNTMHIPDDGQVNANKYTHALTQTSVKNGVTRLGNTEVLSIQRNGDGYVLSTSRGNIFSAKVIVTAGAWSAHLLKQFDVQRTITGVKGEIMLIEHPDVHLNRTLFMTHGFYIIPKLHHRFLIGATSHFNDVSSGMTEEGEDWLWNETISRMPKLNNAEVLMASSGVRPYTEDEQPVMDEVADGLFVASGHYRNGILLSPVIAELMTEWLIQGSRPQMLEAFSIERMKNHAMHR